ncbi:MAG: sigma 54-interacting transcriptional regulator [Clostridiales Family XIII bacterium]|nr:sigma 54-interacting transcriptional regulator [Clostridiales Family XIII bacterium]
MASADAWVFQSIVERFRDGVVVIDVDGVIVYANEAYSRILGVSPERLIGKRMETVEPGAEITKVLHTRFPIQKNPVYIKSLDKYVSVQIFPIEKDGRTVAAVSIFKDATDVAKLEREVEKANKKAMRYKRRIEAENELSKIQIIGKNKNFLNTISQALIAAKTDATVLIKGENGSGKDLIAQAIHANSRRKNKPLIVVNCAAIPESLFESEMFGYEEGSFSGAKKGGKAGRFELANGGTLFLDEIGDMPYAVQSKLLRVLESGEIEKIGREDAVPIDIRLIAATNQPLEKMVREKIFRRDLYFRLNLVEIQAPPLRDRPEDIGLLANHFLEGMNRKYGKSIRLSTEVMAFFQRYDWLGNVRELQNCIEHAVILCPDGALEMRHLPPHMGELSNPIPDAGQDLRPARGKESLREAKIAFESEMMRRAIDASGGNKTRAMEMLDMSRRTFYRKIQKYNL